MNYIIAAYPGIINGRTEFWAKNSLQLHLQKLYELFTKDPIKFMSKIKQISIGVPKEIVSEKIKGYYRKKYWSKKFDVSVVYFPYDGPNYLLSYGQWLVAGHLFPQFPYSILVEDDYYLDTLDFEGKENTYICSLYKDIHNHGLHAAISNGIVDTKILTAFSLKDLSSFKIRYIETQLAFSFMIDSKYKSESFHEKYNAYFWSSFVKKMENFSEKELPQNLFVPLQKLTLSEIKEAYKKIFNIATINNLLEKTITSLQLKNNYFIFSQDYEKDTFFEKILTRKQFFEVITKFLLQNLQNNNFKTST